MLSNKGNDKHPAFLDCKLSLLTRLPEFAHAEVAKTKVKVNYGFRTERPMTQCHYLTLANRPRVSDIVVNVYNTSAHNVLLYC